MGRGFNKLGAHNLGNSTALQNNNSSNATMDESQTSFGAPNLHGQVWNATTVSSLMSRFFITTSKPVFFTKVFKFITISPTSNYASTISNKGSIILNTIRPNTNFLIRNTSYSNNQNESVGIDSAILKQNESIPDLNMTTFQVQDTSKSNISSTPSDKKDEPVNNLGAQNYTNQIRMTTREEMILGQENNDQNLSIQASSNQNRIATKESIVLRDEFKDNSSKNFLFLRKTAAKNKTVTQEEMLVNADFNDQKLHLEKSSTQNQTSAIVETEFKSVQVKTSPLKWQNKKEVPFSSDIQKKSSTTFKEMKTSESRNSILVQRIARKRKPGYNNIVDRVMTRARKGQ
jgi:hypothetical protein